VPLYKLIKVYLSNPALPAHPERRELTGIDEPMDRSRTYAERSGDDLRRQIRAVFFGESGRFVCRGAHDPMESPGSEFVFLNSWAAREAARSPVFKGELDDLRREARVDHPRAGGRAVDYDWMGLEELERIGREPVRPRAHSHKELPTDEGYRWVRDYRGRCRRIAGARLGGKQMAPALHELARREAGYLAVDWRGWVPEGTRASAGAAHITGASHGTGTIANRQAYYRIRADAFTSSSPPFRVRLKREELI
jgi:hypothetical protein